MPRGKVKWFDDEKGHGGITIGPSTEEIFVHSSDIQSNGFKSLDAGDRVEFEITRDPGRGTRALNVRKLL